ncbi:hypothetical protein [Dactylosporangium sp. CS-033363]|uniref:hypothetical protein n=1 Tax=Dactylosporangium sp. CS-033363 TaxID=3239935 RepID=UPI003D93BABC
MNVHVGSGTRLRLHRSTEHAGVWLQIGEATGDVAVFLDGPALARVFAVLHEADDILPAAA